MKLGIRILVMLVFFALSVGCAPTGGNGRVDPRSYEGEPILLSFPFRNGEYYITQGGSTRGTNYHYWSNFFVSQGMHVSVRYAVDIHKVGDGGINKSVDKPKGLEDYAMYGERLYSPCSGVVHYLNDGHPDMPVGVRDMNNPRGNHIVIRQGEIHVAMLHLMPGTIEVAVGDKVEEGQYLGQIGNSGATAVPHLHIQAARGNTWFGEAVPILFDGEFLIRGDTVIRE